jgi:hypothetical protein
MEDLEGYMQLGVATSHYTHWVAIGFLVMHSPHVFKEVHCNVFLLV